MIEKSTLFILFAMIAFMGSTYAELRIWTDVNGESIEAEHVRTLADKVVLRQADGREIRVSLDTLSERDRRYAVLQTPPRIDISVSSDTDRSNTTYGNRRSAQVQEETVSVEVKFRKSSPSPYEEPLTAELFLIGTPAKTGGYMILEKSKQNFSFTAEKKNEYIFASKEVNLQQLDGGRSLGVEFNGYLIAVRDKTESIIALKCSKLDFEKNAEQILAGERGDAFDDEFEPIERKQKKEARKSEKASRNPFSGRRF